MIVKFDSTLRASVLAGVMVISVLMLLGVLLFISLWYNELSLDFRFRELRKQQALLSSAFVRYGRDSCLRECWEQDSSILLFPGDESSRVKYRCKQWGLYELVEVTLPGEKCPAVRLMGKAAESRHRATVYIPDNDCALALAGKCAVEGKACISANGISYTQLRSEFYRGRSWGREKLSLSDREFPAADNLAQEWVDCLFAGAEEGDIRTIESMNVPFTSPVQLLYAPAVTDGYRLGGHILLYAGDKVFIGADNEFSQILIVARKVVIEEGFRGSMQVFARDTIVVGDGVFLGAGSGLWVEGHAADPLIYLGEQCELNAYVVVNGTVDRPALKTAHYYQPGSTVVRGLVYVDGVADVHGLVNGSLYVREPCYFAPEGYYSGLFYNLLVLRHSSVAYPFLLDGPYERRCVAWPD